MHLKSLMKSITLLLHLYISAFYLMQYSCIIQELPNTSIMKLFIRLLFPCYYAVKFMTKSGHINGFIRLSKNEIYLCHEVLMKINHYSRFIWVLSKVSEAVLYSNPHNSVIFWIRLNLINFLSRGFLESLHYVT